MAVLKEVSVSKLRKSLKTVLNENKKAVAVTRKGTDVAVIMSAEYYKEIGELLRFADTLAGK